MSSEVDRDRTKYGKLTVLSVNGKRGICRCECDTERAYLVRHVRSGAITQCGCSTKSIKAAPGSEPRPITKQVRPEYKSTRIGRPPLPPGTTKKEIRQAARKNAREDAKAAKVAAEQTWKEQARLVRAERLASKRKPFLIPVATNVPPEGTIEEWRPCPGYETHYSVSNLGRVMRTNPENNALVGRIIRPMYDDGYQKARLRLGDGKIRMIKIHRLVAIAFVENPYVLGAEVHHVDDCKTNNWSGNLEWLTGSEHRERTERSGRTIAAHGEGNFNTHLTWELAEAIRSQHAQGVTVTKLAKQYFVSDTTIKNLIAGRTWKKNHALTAALPEQLAA